MRQPGTPQGKKKGPLWGSEAQHIANSRNESPNQGTLHLKSQETPPGYLSTAWAASRPIVFLGVHRNGSSLTCFKTMKGSKHNNNSKYVIRL